MFTRFNNCSSTGTGASGVVSRGGGRGSDDDGV
jgi:hypothetical protein